jgi:hypothetical protein
MFLKGSPQYKNTKAVMIIITAFVVAVAITSSRLGINIFDAEDLGILYTAS